jgi:GAF domain-containing protein
VENGIVSEEKHKPVLDEQTLAKLLEAAYVLQEHNREVRELELGLDLKRDQIEAEEKSKAKAASAVAAPKPRDAEPAAQGDYTFTLAQIVATQHQIQIRNLGLEQAMALVAERVIEIARASGAALGMVDGKNVTYRAVAGSKALKLGTQVPTEKALCLPCIRNGQVFRCVNVDPEFLIDTQECRRRGIQSLIAVPIFHEGGVAGGLELYYANQNGFTEQDIHTGQLMAGLITEALARDEELTWKQSLANERAVMLEALEKLKPNLSALVEKDPAKTAAAPDASTATFTCTKCGHKLVSGEQFCGQCGTARVVVATHAAAASPAPVFENKMPASTAAAGMVIPESVRSISDTARSEESLPESIEEEFPDLFGVPEPALDQKKVAKEESVVAPDPELTGDLSRELETGIHQEHEPEKVTEPGAEIENLEDTEAKEPEQVALVKPSHPGDWSSALSAREFLEQVAGVQKRGGLARFWETRRGDIYLAIAVILVACVVRWGIWSNHQVSATNAPPTAAAAHKKAAPDADLSLFDRLLISLGMAEEPETPEDKGNPNTRVWIDQRTALYYCPGADLYGKTPKGKYSTQRDAQLDQYEPAYRKACN